MVEDPRRCSYLPKETASLEVRAVAGLNPTEYADLLARGYRRFGWQVFRPACKACCKCRSLRVLAQKFEPNAADRRVLRKNAGIRAELHNLFVTPEQVALYNRYHHFMQAERGWPFRPMNAGGYYDSFLSGASSVGKQWLYFDGDKLVGVAFMDEAPQAISLVYFFYDPDWRSQSPGRFSILTQLAHARRQQLDYAYLGYWIEECQSMAYKNRFHPHEILAEYVPDDTSPLWR